MKKHLSVFSLYIRASFVPIIVLMILAGIIQTAMFWSELRYDANQPIPAGGYIPGLEHLFGKTAIPYIALAALILVTFLLAVQGTAFSSETSYTMARLSISEKSTFLWQALYNTLVYLMLWAFEAVLMFALCRWYEGVIVNAAGQTVLLALYRVEFFHGLLPLHDAARIVRNACFCLSLGTMTAYFTYTQRNGRASVAIGAMLVYAVGAFRMSDISLSGDIVHILICLFFTAYVIVKVLTGFRFLFEEEHTDVSHEQ